MINICGPQWSLRFLFGICAILIACTQPAAPYALSHNNTKRHAFQQDHQLEATQHSHDIKKENVIVALFYRTYEYKGHLHRDDKLPPIKGATIDDRRVTAFYRNIEIGLRDEGAVLNYTIVPDSVAPYIIGQRVKQYLARATAFAFIGYPFEYYKNELPKIPKSIPVASIDFPGDVGPHALSKLDTVITSNNLAGGAKAAELLCKGMSGEVGTVAILDMYQPSKDSKGFVTHEPTIRDRVNGFKYQLTKRCKQDAIEADITSVDQTDATNMTIDLLQDHPSIRGLFAVNDALAIGAARAIDALGKGRNVNIVGFDGMPEALAAILADRIYGEIQQSPHKMGVEAVKTIDDIIRNKPYKRIELLTVVPRLHEDAPCDFALHHAEPISSDWFGEMVSETKAVAACAFREDEAFYRQP